MTCANTIGWCRRETDKGKANENGSVESPHGHLKNRIKQAIYLRGSRDFASVAEYQAVIDQAAAGLNRQCEAKYAAEKAVLQPLPKRRVADYEILSAKVSCHSTIEVRCILYSVPSWLIGQQVEIHLYHDRLVGYFARQQVFELARLRIAGKGRRRGRCIDYRHLIGGLRKKPRAFLFCKWQSDLLPTAEFRQLWKQLKTGFERDQAAKLIVEALYIAATYDQEQAVCDYMSEALAHKQLTLARLQQQFMPSSVAALPPIETQQHSLDSYDQLLSNSDSASTQKKTTTTTATGSPYQQLSSLLKQLKLTNMLTHWEATESRALQQQWSYAQFLLSLCQQDNGQPQCPDKSRFV